MVGASPKMFNSWSPHCVNILPHIAKRTLLIDYWFWDKKIILDNTITKILIRKKGSRKESEKEMWQQKQRAKWWKGAWAKECSRWLLEVGEVKETVSSQSLKEPVLAKALTLAQWGWFWILTSKTISNVVFYNGNEIVAICLVAIGNWYSS